MPTRSMKVDDPLDGFRASRDPASGRREDGPRRGLWSGGDRHDRNAGYQPARRALQPVGPRCRLHRLHALAVRSRRCRAPADEGAAIFQRACVSAEFRALAANQSSPVTQWLMALARLAHQECGGPGVGAIGMCFTGNFALTMMLEPAVLAPVLSQPSLPLNDPGGLEIAPDDLRTISDRLKREDLTVLAYRFEGDHFCRAQRFAAYAQALGDRFIGRVLPDASANTDVAPFFARHVSTPHSVVTAHLIDEAGQPTIAARDEILAFFKNRLAQPGTCSAGD